jgi:hypothetical protein
MFFDFQLMAPISRTDFSRMYIMLNYYGAIIDIWFAVPATNGNAE